MKINVFSHPYRVKPNLKSKYCPVMLEFIPGLYCTITFNLTKTHWYRDVFHFEITKKSTSRVAH